MRSPTPARRWRPVLHCDPTHSLPKPRERTLRGARCASPNRREGPMASRNASSARVRRYEPTPVYVLAEYLRQEGAELDKIDGPWRPIRRRLGRPGRNAERAIPIVTNGVVEIAVDTAEHAADVSG